MRKYIPIQTDQNDAWKVQITDRQVPIGLDDTFSNSDVQIRCRLSLKITDPNRSAIVYLCILYIKNISLFNIFPMFT